MVEEAGDLHIDDASGLIVYVPMDETSQDVCFASSLPLRLANWLMQSPTTQVRERVDDTALTALTALLGARLSAVGRILDLQGIVRVDIPNQDNQDTQGDDGAQNAHDAVHYWEDDDAGARPRTRGSVIPSTSGSMTPATTSQETAVAYPDDDESDASAEPVFHPYPDPSNLEAPAEQVIDQYPEEDTDPSAEHIVDEYPNSEDSDANSEEDFDRYPDSDDSNSPAEHVMDRYPDSEDSDAPAEENFDPYPEADGENPPAEQIVDRFLDSEDSDAPAEESSGPYPGADGEDPPAEHIVDRYSDSEDSDSPAEQIIARQPYRANRTAVPVIALSPPPELAPHGQLSAEDIHYRALLNRVVAGARTAILPTRGAYDMSSLRDALPGGEITSFDGLDAMNRFRSTSQIERDKKIGAAGELYVGDPLTAD